MTRRGYTMATCFSVLCIGIASVVPMPLRLVWNASASVPIGLYSLHSPHGLHVGDLVAATPPPPLADFMVKRGYLGQNVPLMKHVAALPGQTVCRTKRVITVDGVQLGEALAHDRMGRRLPVWQGCLHLTKDSVFLMNAAVRDSLDGRYFGPIPSRAIIGKATPVYTDETATGQFVWRAGGHGTAP